MGDESVLSAYAPSFQQGSADKPILARRAGAEYSGWMQESGIYRGGRLQTEVSGGDRMAVLNSQRKSSTSSWFARPVTEQFATSASLGRQSLSELGHPDSGRTVIFAHYRFINKRSSSVSPGSPFSCTGSSRPSVGKLVPMIDHEFDQGRNLVESGTPGDDAAITVPVDEPRFCQLRQVSMMDL